MAERITFFEFKDALDQRTMSVNKLGEYVHIDPASPIPKLIFRGDALQDKPAPDYDVDREVYNFTREKRSAARASAAPSSGGIKSIVAEGDSWFNLPEFLMPDAIADCILDNGNFDIDNIAYWGYTLAEILEEREHITVMRDNTPDIFMLSAGGNDLQEGLAEKGYIHQYDSGRDPDDYLTDEGIAGYAQIATGYAEILTEVTGEFPTVNVFCHGYDYPRPLLYDGTYIGQYMRELTERPFPCYFPRNELSNSNLV